MFVPPPLAWRGWPVARWYDDSGSVSTNWRPHQFARKSYTIFLYRSYQFAFSYIVCFVRIWKRRGSAGQLRVAWKRNEKKVRDTVEGKRDLHARGIRSPALASIELQQIHQHTINKPSPDMGKNHHHYGQHLLHIRDLSLQNHRLLIVFRVDGHLERFHQHSAATIPRQLCDKTDGL